MGGVGIFGKGISHTWWNIVLLKMVSDARPKAVGLPYSSCSWTGTAGKASIDSKCFVQLLHQPAFIHKVFTPPRNPRELSENRNGWQKQKKISGTPKKRGNNDMQKKRTLLHKNACIPTNSAWTLAPAVCTWSTLRFVRAGLIKNDKKTRGADEEGLPVWRVHCSSANFPRQYKCGVSQVSPLRLRASTN